jgi:hypothetical protein
MEPVEVFFSYSHRDEKLRDKLALHLAMLQRQGVIKAWHDRKISAGTEWAQAIDDNLNAADIILLLISDSFLASDYCYDIEMKRAMARHEAGEARVIPIILKPVDWSGAAFGKLQAFPKNAKPVTTWNNRDQAFLDIAQGIRQAATEMAAEGRAKQSPGSPETQAVVEGTARSSEEPPVGLSMPNPSPSAVVLEELGGQVPLDSPFYVERPPIEQRCYEAIVKPGALVRIKAPRQMGKSSLMLRILNYGNQQGYQSATLNFLMVDREALSNLEPFLQWFCTSIADELNLEDKLADYWKGAVSPKNKCTNYFQRYLLPELQRPVTLCLDEVDQVFEYPAIATDFFGMLRAWHEDAKIKPIWKHLRLVIVHSKEVYIPLNINQSPFNVGVPIELPPWSQAQVMDLAQRHGLNWTAAEVTQLMGMVGGHPYLIRAALYQIVLGELSLEQLLQAAPTEGGLYGEHLRRHLLNLEGDEKLLAAMKQVIAVDQPISINTSEAFKLTSMGLVQFHGSDVAPTCNLYRQYFRSRLRVGGRDA